MYNAVETKLSALPRGYLLQQTFTPGASGLLLIRGGIDHTDAPSVSTSSTASTIPLLTAAPNSTVQNPPLPTSRSDVALPRIVTVTLKSDITNPSSSASTNTSTNTSTSTNSTPQATITITLGGNTSLGASPTGAEPAPSKAMPVGAIIGAGLGGFALICVVAIIAVYLARQHGTLHGRTTDRGQRLQRHVAFGSQKSTPETRLADSAYLNTDPPKPQTFAEYRSIQSERST